ncbi:hypothetical protein EYF80_031984 [Liparis tanakae]|uniref:Uncharacterized protein n=1 Tax=Liparis tanakae TaxID=230148 RepID=A0A4Z2GX23_9TELE|nr:hypothetical protein EYF80_031984 [Liparis tanakae]
MNPNSCSRTVSAASRRKERGAVTRYLKGANRGPHHGGHVVHQGRGVRHGGELRVSGSRRKRRRRRRRRVRGVARSPGGRPGRPMPGALLMCAQPGQL